METLEFLLSPTYIHKGQIFSLLSEAENRLLKMDFEEQANYYQHNELDAVKRSIFCRWLIKILQGKDVLSLEKALLEGLSLETGTLVWVENTFYFKGLSSWKRNPKGGYMPKIGQFHGELKGLNIIRVEGNLNAEHAQTDSTFLNLSGRQTSSFIFGFVESFEIDTVKIKPLYIGNRILRSSSPYVHSTSDDLFIPVNEIDEFSRISEVKINSVKLATSKEISEIQIKQWFAEILQEGNVSKDWGGETSDLYTTNIHIKGKRKRAAFIFKGPSKFHLMRIGDLGKNGNQMQRLYDEDADIYILQHCHNVDPEIYKMMRTYSSNFRHVSRFCIIQGVDSLRLYKAYGKIE
jgi:hypothetical protein